MTSLVIEYKEFVIPIFTALIMGIGYLLKELSQKKKNKKVALFLLLEIWFRISPLILVKNNKNEITSLRKFCEKYNYTLTEEVEKSAIELFTNISKSSMENMYGDDLSSYEKKFEEAIMLIASEDPIFAYKINNVEAIKKLDIFKKSAEEEINKTYSELHVERKYIQEGIDLHDENEKYNTLLDFEKNIKTLAVKISIYTYFKTIYQINSRKKYLKSILEVDLTKEEEEILNRIMMEYFNSLKNTLNELNEKDKEHL